MEALISHLSKPLVAIDLNLVNLSLINIRSSSVSPCIASYDQMCSLFTVMRSDFDISVRILIIQVFQQLMTRQENRIEMSKGKYGIETIVLVLNKLPKHFDLTLAEELLRLIAILGYEDTNTKLLVADGVLLPIIILLRRPDESLILCCLTAIQAICCTKEGRKDLFLSKDNAMEKIGTFLNSVSSSIRARASGIFHNLSVDTHYISILREANIIVLLVPMLNDPCVEACQAVVGTIQNLSREFISRNIIVSIPNTVESLVDLVFGNDIDCQIAAIGALLNVLGPSLKESEMNDFKSFLTEGLVLGAIRSCIFDPA